MAGGHCAFNPEPLADFVDAFVLGDGEEVVGRDQRGHGRLAGRRHRRSERDRDALPALLAGLEGVYVPALYTPTYEDGRLVSTVPDRCPACRPRWPSGPSADLADWPYPARPLVPLTEVVHDRLNVEVFRGCTRGCRFCQAGMITRPVRERPAAQVSEMVQRGLELERPRRGDADLAVDGGLLGHRGHGPRHRRRSRCTTGGSRSACPSLRVDAFTVGTAAADPKGAPHRPHLRPRGRDVADAHR